METFLLCDCGYEARGDDEESVAEQARGHAWDAHQMRLSRDEARALIARQATRPATPLGDEPDTEG